MNDLALGRLTNVRYILKITTLWARFTVLVTNQGHVVTEQPPPLEVDTSGASSSKSNHNSNNAGLCRFSNQRVRNRLREAGIFLRRPARVNSTSRLGVVPSRHHVIQHMNVNGGMIQHDRVRPHVTRVSPNRTSRSEKTTPPQPLQIRPQVLVQSLIACMRCHCQAVIGACGGHDRY